MQVATVTLFIEKTCQKVFKAEHFSHSLEPSSVAIYK